MKRFHFCASALTMALCACNGKVDGALSAPPPPVAIGTLPIPVTTPVSTTFDTEEDQASNAALLANALPAYRAGATGKGVRIGVVDTGLNAGSPELAGRIDGASSDVAGNRGMYDNFGHGSAISSLIAATRDGTGMHGIAYNSSIVMLKADTPGTCPQACNFDHDSIAAGIDAARAAGVRVINLSIGGGSSDKVDAAIERATKAGIVVVVAAGNDGLNDPTEFARHVAGIGKGSAIVVGALGADTNGSINYNELISYSNQAGSTANGFLGAPAYLVRALTQTDQLDLHSGTSFAAPTVTGAIALLAEAFPNLSATQLVSLLLTTADDLGSWGIDSKYGNGRLNIGRAFAPVGTTTIAGTSTAVLATQSGILPAAAGDASLGSGITAVVLDDFSRAYTFDLTSGLGRVAPAGVLQSLLTEARSSSAAFGRTGLALTVSGSERYNLATFAPSAQEMRSAKVLAGSIISRIDRGRAVAMGLATSESQLGETLEGKGFAIASLTGGPRFGFTGTSGKSVAMRQVLGNLGLTVSGETGRLPVPGRQASIYRLISAGLDHQLGRARVALHGKAVVERDTVLGGQFSSGLGKAGSKSLFFDAEASSALGSSWSVTGTLRRGWTSFAAGRLKTGAASLGLLRTSSDNQFSFKVSQPLAIMKGGLDVTLPVSFDYSTGNVGMARQRISLAPNHRELAGEFAYNAKITGGSLGANVFLRHNPGHMGSEPADVGAAIRLSFGL